MQARDLEKAAACGEPSYVWRAGQERRLEMIRAGSGGTLAMGGCWRTAAGSACMPCVWRRRPAGDRAGV